MDNKEKYSEELKQNTLIKGKNPQEVCGWREEDMLSWYPVPALLIQHVPEVLLASEAVKQQRQRPNDGLHPAAAQRPHSAMPFPEAPNGSHPPTHIPEWVYLWTWTPHQYISGIRKKTDFNDGWIIL